MQKQMCMYWLKTSQSRKISYTHKEVVRIVTALGHTVEKFPVAVHDKHIACIIVQGTVAELIAIRKTLQDTLHAKVNRNFEVHCRELDAVIKMFSN